MAVEWVHQINRRGRLNATERQFTVTYEVKVDDQNDTEVVALTAPGIPNIGQAHPQDPQAFCSDVDANLRNERDWRLYVVSAEYTTQQPEEGSNIGGDPNQPPDQRAPELSVEMVPFETEMLVDLDGKTLQNTAGQFLPYEQRLVTKYRAVIRYKRWWRPADFDIVADSYASAGKVNGSEWRGVAARCALITRLVITRIFFEGQLYYEAEYEISLSEDTTGWVKKVWSEGFLAKPIVNPDPGDTQGIMAPIRFGDAENPDILVDTPEPVALDELGFADPDGLGAELSFRVYEDADFTALGL